MLSSKINLLKTMFRGRYYNEKKVRRLKINHTLRLITPRIAPRLTMLGLTTLRLTTHEHKTRILTPSFTTPRLRLTTPRCAGKEPEKPEKPA
jgi:hypothetical protein